MENNFTLVGGLGDVIRQCFIHEPYRLMSDPDTRGVITYCSPNPGVPMLLADHPAVREGRYRIERRPDADLFTQSWWHPGNYADRLQPISFYCGAEAYLFSPLCPSSERAGDYIYVAGDASCLEKCMRINHYRRILHENGITPVKIQYPPHYGTRMALDLAANYGLPPHTDWFREMHPVKQMQIVYHAQRVYCAHSAVNIMAWMLNTPQTVFIPKWLHWDLYRSEGYKQEQDWYGLDNPNTEFIIYDHTA